MAEVSNSKRLAKNTALMYVRMIFLLCISFYTSRVVLQKLGVTDYGIYNVVGSVVAMFASLRSIFAMSTQRFLNYEMGAGNHHKLNTIFNTSFLINALLAVVFVVLVEGVGLWFIYNKMNVPSDRFDAAFWSFQLSLATAIVTLFNTTFDAEIIAHERMNFYAYLSIIEGILKLAIVYMLSITSYDRLILYSILHMGVFLCICLCNIIYCRRNFQECRFNFKLDRTYIKRMTSFAGWNFIGTNAYVVSQNGINMVLNFFGGPVVNAARGIAFQVSAAVVQFINNVVIVVNPYCIKTYAEGNHRKAMDAIILSSKILFTVQLCVSVPLIILTKPLLFLWLGEVPEYSTSFVKLVLLYSIIRSVHPCVDVWFKAVGNIKYYQIFEGVMLLLPILVSYMVLRYGMSFDSVFVTIAIFEALNLIGIIFIAKQISSFSVTEYTKRVLLPCFSLLTVLIFLYIISNSYLTVLSLHTVLVTIGLLVSILLYIFFVAFNNNEKHLVTSLLKSVRKHK